MDYYFAIAQQGPPMQTAAEAFMPMWILVVVVGAVVIGGLLASFGVVFAVAGMRSGSARPPVPDAAPCPKCGSLVPLAKRDCPACGARVA